MPPALTVGVGDVPSPIDDALDLVVPDPSAVVAALHARSGRGGQRRAPAPAPSGVHRRGPGRGVDDVLDAAGGSGVRRLASHAPRAAGRRRERAPRARRAGRAGHRDRPHARRQAQRRSTSPCATSSTPRSPTPAGVEGRWSSPPTVRRSAPAVTSTSSRRSPIPRRAHLVRLDRSLAAAFAALADRLVVGLHGACLGAGIELPAFAGSRGRSRRRTHRAAGAGAGPGSRRRAAPCRSPGAPAVTPRCRCSCATVRSPPPKRGHGVSSTRS